MPDVMGTTGPSPQPHPGLDHPGGSSGSAPFRLQGAVTANRADQLATALADYGSTTTGDVVVDASELTAIDMTALDALKTAQGALHDSGRRLVLDHWPVQYRGALVRAGISSLAGFGFERSP